MSYSETEIPLEANDRKRLKTLRLNSFAGMFLFTLIFFAAIYCFGFRNADHTARIFIGVFSAFFVLILVFVSWIIVSRFNRDLKAGVKKRITGIVTDKMREMQGTQRGKNANRYYYLLFGDQKVAVDRKTYDSVHRGNELQLDQSLTTGVIFLCQTDNATQPVSEKSIHSGANDFVDDKEALLTDVELSILQKTKKRAARKWVIRSLLWILPFTLLFILLVFLVALNVNKPLAQVLVIWFGVPALYIYFRVVMFRKQVRSITIDMLRGKKIIRPQMINEKITSNVRMLGPNTYTGHGGEYYYIVSEKRFVQVSRDSFNALRENVRALLHIAPTSQIVLRIEHA